MVQQEFFVLQNKSNPSVFYKEKRGEWRRGLGNPVQLVEVKDIKTAKKYRSITEISKSLDKAFSNTLKAQIADVSGGLAIIKCQETVILTEEEPTEAVQGLIAGLEQVSNMIKETHYSTIELYNKLRNDPELVDYKFILSTAYDRLSTSKLMELFNEHGLNPIKYKGNFAFDREEYWTAAKMICDVPFKSFNLNKNATI